MTKGWTFQSLIDARMEVRAFCKQVLDLVKVRDRFGPQWNGTFWPSAGFSDTGLS